MDNHQSNIFSSIFNKSSVIQMIALAGICFSPISAYACDPLTEICALGTPGATATPTVSETPTLEPSETPTSLPTVTVTFTPSATATITFTSTSIPTITPESTTTFTPTATSTPRDTNTSVPTATATLSPTQTRSVDPKSSPTVTATLSPTQTIGLDPTSSPTVTVTLSPTQTRSVGPKSSPTVTPTQTIGLDPTSSPTVTATLSPTQTIGLDPTASPTITVSSTPTAKATSTSSQVQTRTPTPIPTNTSNGGFGSDEDTKNIYVPAKCSPLEVYPFIYALDTAVSDYYGRIVDKRFLRVRATLLKASSPKVKKSLRRSFDLGIRGFRFQISQAKRALAPIDPVLVMCPTPAPSRCSRIRNPVNQFRDAVVKLNEIVNVNFAKAVSKPAFKRALASLFKKSFTTENTPKISESAAKNLIIYSEKIPVESWRCRK